MLFAPLGKEQQDGMQVFPIDMEQVNHSGSHAGNGMAHHFELQMHCEDLTQWKVGDDEICNGAECREYCSKNLKYVIYPGNVFHKLSLYGRPNIEFDGLVRDGDGPEFEFRPCKVEVEKRCTENCTDAVGEACVPDVSRLVPGGRKIGSNELYGRYLDGDERIAGRAVFKRGTLSASFPEMVGIYQKSLMWKFKKGLMGKTIQRGRIPNVIALIGSSPSGKVVVRIEASEPRKTMELSFSLPETPSGQRLELILANDPDRVAFCQRSYWEIGRFRDFVALYDLLDFDGNSRFPWPRVDSWREREEIRKDCDQGVLGGSGPVYCYGAYNGGPP